MVGEMAPILYLHQRVMLSANQIDRYMRLLLQVIYADMEIWSPNITQ